MIDNESKKRWALYTRESTKGQLEGKSYDSHAIQEDLLRKHVEARGGVVVRVYSDTESGTSLDKRSEMRELLADARAGKFDVAVAYDIDRWARHVGTFASLMDLEREIGVRFVSMSQPYDDSPEGEMMANNVAAYAQYYSQVVSRKVKLKRQMMVEKGMWAGGGVPFGYTNKLVPKQLVPEPGEAAVVREMFRLYAELRSNAQVRDALRARGVATRKGREWTSTSITQVLQNRVYIGKLRNGDEVYDGSHEPIIEAELFEEVQRVMPVKRRALKPDSREYPLIDVLHCGGCGSRMTSHYVQKRNGKRIAYYRCTATFKKHWGACAIKQVNADRMEAEVLRTMDDLTATPDLVTAAVAASNESKDDRLKPLRDQEAELAERLRTLDAQVTNLVDVLKESGAAAFASVHDALKQAEADRATVERELARHREAIREVARSRADPDRVLAVLDDFRLGYELALPAERRELIRALFKRIEYQGPGELLRLELFDRNAIPKPELKEPAGSILPTGWLRVGSARARRDRRAALWRDGGKWWR